MFWGSFTELTMIRREEGKRSRCLSYHYVVYRPNLLLHGQVDDAYPLTIEKDGNCDPFHIRNCETASRKLNFC